LIVTKETCAAEDAAAEGEVSLTTADEGGDAVVKEVQQEDRFPVF